MANNTLRVSRNHPTDGCWCEKQRCCVECATLPRGATANNIPRAGDGTLEVVRCGISCHTSYTAKFSLLFLGGISYKTSATICTIQPIVRHDTNSARRPNSSTLIFRKQNHSECSFHSPSSTQQRFRILHQTVHKQHRGPITIVDSTRFVFLRQGDGSKMFRLRNSGVKSIVFSPKMCNKILARITRNIEHCFAGGNPLYCVKIGANKEGK